MPGTTRRVLMFSLAVGGLAACADRQPSAPEATPDGIGPAAAVTTGACSLVRGIASDARSWFSQPEQKVAQGQVQTISSDCKNGDQAAVASDAWGLLRYMETTLEAEHAGDPGVGSSLVNALLGCTTSLCEVPPNPVIPFDGALSSQGLFAVRSGSTTPAIARNAVHFTDIEGTDIAAFWGVEVDQPWSAVTFTDPVIIYGHPVTSNGLPLSEASIGNIQYKLDVYPDAGLFLDGALHVGACFNPEAVYDDGTHPYEPRLQREGVLLETATPGFCGTVYATVQTASVFGSFFALAREYVAPLFGITYATKGAPAVGGTPLDFSRFAPVAANTNGTLQFLTQPDPTPTENQPIGTIRVLAESGAGTPMEKVLVTLSILNNHGVPAGAVLGGTLSTYTEELAGEQGIATFTDVTVGKPGGYTICATASLAGFTFAQACSNLFNVKNSN